MRALLAPAAAFAALLSAAPLLAAPQAEDGETKVPDLRGSYKIAAGEKFGEQVPPDRLKDNSVVITADTFAVVDKDSKNLYASTYKLMPAKNLKLKNKDGVWFADLISTIPDQGSKAPALIRVQMKKPKEGQENAEPEIAGLILIYSLSDERPTRFKTGAKDLLFRLRKTTDPTGDAGKKPAAGTPAAEKPADAE
ncbi:hypothetical protein [Alienimonas californiensis]|uniref:Uncharacterized protein n=1 Tax=Alienimonas californiensis TaxID=2527989 RepID=A0A517P594_9PLAN|nr:hypothetical protein [Alienimonas californiensis]QDT14549.1 hypothetical protein CA12_06240 [Alienimonas californiensis]